MMDHPNAEVQQENLRQLLLQTARGDQAAFHRLYEQTSQRLYTVSLRLMRRRDLADEVLQETYVKIWYNAGEYISERGSVLTWMMSILRYRAIDRMRKLKRELDTEEADTIDDQLVDKGKGPLEFIDAAVEAKVLYGCLDELVENQKYSIGLAFFDGLTHEQLSQKLGTPLGTVKSWIRRGLILLRQCINNEIQRS